MTLSLSLGLLLTKSRYCQPGPDSVFTDSLDISLLSSILDLHSNLWIQVNLPSRAILGPNTYRSLVDQSRSYSASACSVHYDSVAALTSTLNALHFFAATGQFTLPWLDLRLHCDFIRQYY